MITLSDDKGNKIELSYNNEITLEQGNRTTCTSYKVNLPVVICSNSSDAKYIQQRVNELVSDLAHELIK